MNLYQIPKEFEYFGKFASKSDNFVFPPKIFKFLGREKFFQPQVGREEKVWEPILYIILFFLFKSMKNKCKLYNSSLRYDVLRAVTAYRSTL
jgi:hypothetical protein